MRAVHVAFLLICGLGMTRKEAGRPATKGTPLDLETKCKKSAEGVATLREGDKVVRQSSCRVEVCEKWRRHG